MESLKLTLAVLWVAFGLVVYLFVLLCAVDAALSHEWIQGCFWVLVLILFRIAKSGDK